MWGRIWGRAPFPVRGRIEHRRGVGARARVYRLVERGEDDLPHVENPRVCIPGGEERRHQLVGDGRACGGRDVGSDVDHGGARTVCLLCVILCLRVRVFLRRSVCGTPLSLSTQSSDVVGQCVVVHMYSSYLTRLWSISGSIL